jgi:hypothetical protein
MSDIKNCNKFVAMRNGIVCVLSFKEVLIH